MKQLLLSLLFALMAVFGLQAQTIWDGTADTSWYDETSTEFEISTAEQLAGLAELVNNGNDFSGKTILITADIVLNDTSDWENWESSSPNNTWTPIGANWNNPFYCTFDGQGHTVSGIYINSANSDQGLFGYNGGTIKNVGVKKSYIKGYSYIGGVCGYNYGTISNCYNSGTVNGSDDYVGGVCGYNEYGTISGCYNAGTVNGNEYVGGVCGSNGGTISGCYNAGTVSGNEYVGGVCGQNPYGTISGCYNAGTVNGNEDDDYVGGVCGSNGGTISDCCHLQGSATGGINGNDTSGQAEVKTAEQFASGEVCWLLNGSSDTNPTWFQTLGTDDTPVLDNTHGTVYATGRCPNDGNNTYSNQGPSRTGEHSDNDKDGFCDFCGKIMPQEPAQSDGIYQISNCAELYWFAGLVNGTLDGVGQNTAADAVLVADIIINKNVPNADGSLTSNTESLLAWTPIGQNYNNPFRGSFDGQGHTVSGIYINSEKFYQGLFGYNMGTIKNVGVAESYIKGYYDVGGVCGYNDSYGTISNCYNSGTVSGYWSVGGVCGQNSYCTISNCYNSGIVNGDRSVGGVCGQNSYGTISNCYYLEGTAEGGIDGEDISNRAKVKTAEQFASGEVCWLLNEEQSEGAWGQKLGTDPCPVLGGPAVFKNGETYYNEEGSAIVETNSEQASFVIVPENLTINIYGSDGEATVYNLAGNIVYKGSERIIPVTTAGMYLVRIGNEVQKTVVR